LVRFEQSRSVVVRLCGLPGLEGVQLVLYIVGGKFFFFVSGQGDGGDWDIGPPFESFLQAAFEKGGHPELKGFRPTHFRKLMHVFLKEMGISGDARVAILEHTPTTAYNHYEIKDVVDLHIDF
jgi:hypothetical protein